jgi:hypothetical protein
MTNMTRLIGCLQTYWASVGLGDVPTQFPGMLLNGNASPGWFEFWVSEASDLPIRSRQAGGRMQVLIDVHCFVRGPWKHTVFELADQARDALAGHTLTWPAEGSAAQPGGALRLGEAVCRDLTRQMPLETRSIWQHVVVSLTGTVDELPA